MSGEEGWGLLVNQLIAKENLLKIVFSKGKGIEWGHNGGLNILLAINRDKSFSLNTETTKGTPCFFIRICGKNIKIY